MDGRKTVAGNKKANFFVCYEVDSDVVKHNLAMEDYGEEDRWVLPNLLPELPELPDPVPRLVSS